MCCIRFKKPSQDFVDRFTLFVCWCIAGARQGQASMWLRTGLRGLSKRGEVNWPEACHSKITRGSVASPNMFQSHQEPSLPSTYACNCQGPNVMLGSSPIANSIVKVQRLARYVHILGQFQLPAKRQGLETAVSRGPNMPSVAVAGPQ
jgi:hypothetical protein